MGTKVIGRQRSWQKFEVGGIQQSTGPLFEMMNRTTRRLVGGSYKVSWNVEVGNLTGALGSDVRVRMSIDGSQQGTVYEVTPGPDFTAHSGFDILDFLDDDQPNVIFDLKRVNGTDTAQARRVKVVFERLGDS